MKMGSTFSEKPRSLLRQAFLCLLVGAFAAASANAQQYQFIDLGAGYAPEDISNNRVVVGSRKNSDGSTIGFVYALQSGTNQYLPRTVAATGVSDGNRVGGNTSTGAFVYANGVVKRRGRGYHAGRISNFGLMAGTKTGVNPTRSCGRRGR